MQKTKKLLVVDVAALGWKLVQRHPPADERLAFRPAETVFPAVTCPVQAAFRTGRSPADGGLESNGVFLRELRKVAFWEQSANLVRGDRLWRAGRAQGQQVGLLFWQQSLGEQADLILSPRPIHKHHGGMIEDCYSQPHDLYARLCGELGRPFPLRHYWGPLAAHPSSAWIAAATCTVMALESTYADLALLWTTAVDAGYDVLIFGDYAIEPVAGAPVFPNRALRAAGLFQVRTVQGRAYPDFFASAAFAMVDHQIAQVFALDDGRRPDVRRTLEQLDGVDAIHERGRDFLVAAQPGRWFAYPWWESKRAAPDYAGHVDIHSKPGYDPCELFFGWPPGRVSQDAARVRGTHGLAGPGREIAWAASGGLGAEAKTLLDLSRAVRNRMESS
ncbi:MAG: alkaline phosphatase family protein [Kiritimatiellaeota bacterium]|nr:alkaline phosphatase family protein [Kiritimatiellota bacterium]